MWGWDDGPNGWGWFWMVAMMSIMWLPLLFAAIWLLTQFGRGGPGRNDDGDRPDARELARRGYARGEIERERYLQIIQDLEHDDAARKKS